MKFKNKHINNNVSYIKLTSNCIVYIEFGGRTLKR